MAEISHADGNKFAVERVNNPMRAFSQLLDALVYTRSRNTNSSLLGIILPTRPIRIGALALRL